MNEIAVIEQLPIITERIKEIGENLDKRLEEMKLDNLVCNEDTKKEIKNLRTSLGNELKEFETQRKNIKNRIMLPYEEFNKIYEEEIKTKYQKADLILADKINEVESQIKHDTEVKMNDFFEEYRQSKNIPSEYLKFCELDIKNGLNLLTTSGELVKKVKDEIKAKVDLIEQDINTINTMEYSGEILVEYLKNKNLSVAIREVNDRHMILDTIQESNREIKEKQEQEEQIVTQVEEALQAPVEEDIIDGQMSINDFEKNEEIFEVTFTAKGTKTQLRNLKQFLDAEGIDYE
ncbi:MAG: DUF1351 domain-containing protein [Bacilli bacterium]|nr:DUF1351 domain-containing protein [Bacilli bacterium]